MLPYTPLHSFTFDDGVGALIFYNNNSPAIATNQTGGYACHHPEISADYIRLVRTDLSLTEHFCGPQYKGWCCKGITKSTADWLDDKLSHLDFKTDRDNLDKCEEAWIYGFVDDDPVILTWENSD